MPTVRILACYRHHYQDILYPGAPGASTPDTLSVLRAPLPASPLSSGPDLPPTSVSPGPQLGGTPFLSHPHSSFCKLGKEVARLGGSPLIFPGLRVRIGGERRLTRIWVEGS